MENELYHHGIKGQRWGVRRYQNKDGSLTLAGKKRALKIEKEYSELTGKQLGGHSQNNNSSKDSQPSNSKNGQKNISEMSNKEIQDRIDRIRLEKTLSSLTPDRITAGQKFANGLKNSAISIIKDKGTKIVGDYIDKKVRDTIGLNDKKTKTTSDILREMAQDYENRQKVDRGQRYFKEGKYTEK